MNGAQFQTLLRAIRILLGIPTYHMHKVKLPPRAPPPHPPLKKKKKKKNKIKNKHSILRKYGAELR